MREKYTLLALIWCKWLDIHIIKTKWKISAYDKNIKYADCCLCGHIVLRKVKRGE